MYTDALGEHSRLEEEYFLKKDRELIDKMKKTEVQKAQLLERTAHYHKCGCCGHDMQVKTFENLEFMQCQSCESLQFTPKAAEALSRGRSLRNLLTDLEIEKQELEQSA